MATRDISNVEIAICTWNRHELLTQTLESVQRLHVPESVSLNVLVVDNHSTDSTPDVIQQFATSANSAIEVIPLFEPQQGHTFSRNRAIEAATGQLMLWTDDDVILDRNWVAKYVEAARKDQESVFWGSVIKPVFQAGCPRWIEENWETLQGCFAARDLGADSVELNSNRLPYGANFAIRTDVQKQYRYSTELGRRGEEVLGEDELDLFRRLLDRGQSGCWVPGAVVEHCIPSDRVTESYVFDYFVGQGKALVAKGEAWHSDLHRLKSEAKSEYVRYKWKRLCFRSSVWVGHLLRSALARGQAEALESITPGTQPS